MATDPEVDPQPVLENRRHDAAGTVVAQGHFEQDRIPALRIPNIGHALVFLAVFGGALLLVQTLALGTGAGAALVST